LCNKFALDGGHVSHTRNAKNLRVDPEGYVLVEKYHVSTEEYLVVAAAATAVAILLLVYAKICVNATKIQTTE
jgi:hypothetical protein